MSDEEKKNQELKSIMEALFYQNIDVEEAMKRVQKIIPSVVTKVIDSGAGCVY